MTEPTTICESDQGASVRRTVRGRFLLWMAVAVTGFVIVGVSVAILWVQENGPGVCRHDKGRHVAVIDRATVVARGVHDPAAGCRNKPVGAAQVEVALGVLGQVACRDGEVGEYHGLVVRLHRRQRGDAAGEQGWVEAGEQADEQHDEQGEGQEECLHGRSG